MLMIGLDGRPYPKPGARGPWVLLAFGVFLAMDALLLATVGTDPAAPVAILGASVTAKALVAAAYILLLGSLGYAARRSWQEFRSWFHMAMAFWLAGAAAALLSIAFLVAGHVGHLW